MTRKSAFARLAALACLLLGAALPVFAESSTSARLDPLFGDHMVLQRDQPIRLWGSAAPGARLSVTLAGAEAKTRADAKGEWALELAPLAAGGPHALALLEDGDEVQRVDDVLLGDVYLCSGQSNMEWPVSRSSGADGGLYVPDASIRLFTVAKDSQPHTLNDLATAPTWQVADAESVPHFSAVCWFFARSLRKDIDLPLGLVNSSWGGSQIEAWMSATALGKVDGFDPALEMLATYAADRSAGSRMFGERWETWWRQTVPGLEPWAPGAGSEANWKPVPQAMGDWKEYGDPDLKAHHGMVWFRRDFELDAAQAAGAAKLHLGSIDEVDAAWVSGQFAGAQFGWGTAREYSVPQGFLKAGANSLTVNVLNTWGQGGMIGPPDQVGLRFANGDFLPLGSDWKYRRVDPALGWPPRAPWESVGGLTGMYNAMIAPLFGLRLAGALWYQGESNAGRGRAYEALLAGLIADWRQGFGQAQLPFMVVQLPGFGAMSEAPVESGWAELRESQRRVAVADPHTGLASVMDVGDPFDIHPANKQVVGQRLAAVASVLVYGKTGLADGLSAISARRVDGTVVLDFSQAGALPVVRGSGQPAGFELCGDEAGSCAYASAELDGALLTLRAPNSASATRVRHAWADTPIVNLYSASGVPVGSFELPVSD